MKRYITILLFLPFAAVTVTAQKTNPQNIKEIQDKNKEMLAEYEKLTPEQKKMMEQMGIKIPDVSGTLGADSKAIDKAMGAEFGIVPSKDAARIAAIPKGVTSGRMLTYIASIQKKTIPLLEANTVKMGDDFFTYLTKNGIKGDNAGNLAAAFWADGKTQLALYLMGKIYTQWPTDNNLGNYAAMVSMMGGAHLAIPVLEMLNGKYRDNSTLLNNLGQAWFNLGELGKAEKYIDSTLALYPFHPQANMTRASLLEKKGDKPAAIAAIKKSLKHSYSREKENRLRKLGYSLKPTDFYLPPKASNDPLNLGGFQTPSFPTSIDECLAFPWKDVMAELDARSSKLQQEVAQAASQDAMKALSDYNKMAADQKAGKSIQGKESPMYSNLARKQLDATKELYNKKMKDLTQRFKTFINGDYTKAKKEYEQEYKKLEKEELAQVGEGLANANFCARYKKLANTFLGKANPTLEKFYREYLTLEKNYINESANQEMYIYWPAEYSSYLKKHQLKWLNDLRTGLGEGGTYPYPFVNITEIVCAEPPQKHSAKLSEFDTTSACKYKSTLNLGIIYITSNCSHTTYEFNLKEIPFSDIPLKDIEFTYRQIGNQYESSTIKFATSKIGMGAELGPLKAEAGVGSKWTAEMGPDGLKSWDGTVTADVELSAEAEAGIVKAGASIGSGIELEIGSSGNTDVNLVSNAKAGAGIEGVKEIEIGVESRSSIISGKGAINGTGLLEKVVNTKW